jgi:hypothetical protein
MSQEWGNVLSAFIGALAGSVAGGMVLAAVGLVFYSRHKQ